VDTLKLATFNAAPGIDLQLIKLSKASHLKILLAAGMGVPARSVDLQLVNNTCHKDTEVFLRFNLLHSKFHLSPMSSSADGSRRMF